ncbi:MAG: putative secreted protein [Polyangiaceae bacterium]|nr:putative secreted protein [Polyangiaceae bacterium]
MRDRRFLFPAVLGALLSCGCSSESLDAQASGSETPTPQAVELTEVFRPSARVELSATALAFNAAVEDELWVALRQFPSGLPCTMTDDRGCSALPGAMAVVSGATGDAPEAVVKQDGNAWHFMRHPTAMAWGEGKLFAACGEALTDNYEDVDIPYAGPALWSSDPAIFGVTPKPDQNGTHLDMLHETPYCMGIAHEAENAYWLFNGDAGSLDRVDFHAPHQIGGEDHADGEVHRYVDGQLLRVPEVPSHVAYDAERGVVYAADTGHQRVVSVDPSTATPGGKIDVWEILEDSGMRDGAILRELVRPGALELPSGLAFEGGKLYVTDNATSFIHVLDADGNSLAVYDTQRPSGSLSGITVGPDGKLYVTDLKTGTVARVESPPL